MIHTTGNLKFNSDDMILYANPKIEVDSIYASRDSSWNITMNIAVYSENLTEKFSKSIVVPIEILSSSGANSEDLVTNLAVFLENYLIATLTIFNDVTFTQT